MSNEARPLEIVSTRLDKLICCHWGTPLYRAPILSVKDSTCMYRGSCCLLQCSHQEPDGPTVQGDLLHFPHRKVDLSDMTAVYTALAEP